jgi:hypothetical protein
LPGTVDKFADDFRWTSIQPLDGCSFGLFKILLFFLTISVFGPSQILNNYYIFVVIRQENILTISMRFNSQWNLGRNITSCPLLLINSSIIET